MGDLKPLWSEFPDIPRGSAGWRMGHGEVYAERWGHWFKQLSESARVDYKNLWPEPIAWTGFYRTVETGELPPTVAEQRRRIAEAAIPLSAEETEVTDPHRIWWLVQSHLKAVAYPHFSIRDPVRSPSAIESDVKFYIAPLGGTWRLGFLAKGGLTLRKVCDLPLSAGR